MTNNRYIISTEKGFICDVDLADGKIEFDGFSFSRYKAQPLTTQQVNILIKLLFANYIEKIEQIALQ